MGQPTGLGVTNMEKATVMGGQTYRLLQITHVQYRFWDEYVHIPYLHRPTEKLP